MPDPQTPTTLTQLFGLALAALLGTGGKVGWDKWRRNGNGSADADRIVAAIDRHNEDEERGRREIVSAIRGEGKETRTVMREHTGAITALSVEIAKK